MTPDRNFEARLSELLAQNPAVLRGGLKGLEKESLRVDADGGIARTPHPVALGAALTHPNITTDYSEALLELVTMPFADTRDTLHSLCDIHTFIYQHLPKGEMLWASSMPCALGADEEIPIAEYGRSNIGMMKHVYRRGLGYRYGRSMQTISGVHFNYSFPETLWPVLHSMARDSGTLRRFIDERYLAMLRNFQRVSWLLLYLFGASPALCKSFLHGHETGFSKFDDSTRYEPYATSLRMSDIGYKNSNQATLGISYNSLEDYLATLTRAVTTPLPAYEAIGVKVDGEYRQLNANVLQIENEFYSFARPKQPINRSERPSVALRRRGVRYVEVRALDVNIFEPLGTSVHALHFIEALLTGCLLSDSPPLDDDEQAAINHNQTGVARYGRDPDWKLVRDGQSVSLRTWGRQIIEALEPICAALDGDDHARPYRTALDLQRESIDHSDRTPSARVLAEMRAHHESFFEFSRRLSQRHRDFFVARELPENTAREFVRLAQQSLSEQAAIEAAETLSFDDYLQKYFEQA